MISTYDTYTQLAAVLFVYIPVPINRRTLASLMDSAIQNGGNRVDKAIRQLVDDKVIRRAQNNNYLNRAVHTVSSYTEWVGAAAADNMLPGTAELSRALSAGAFKNSNVESILAVADMARFFISGGDPAHMSPRLKLLSPSQLTKDFYRAVACHVATLVKDEPAFSFSGAKDVLLKVVPFWLNIRFLHGGPVVRTLEALDNVLASGGKFENSLVQAYAAACFWTARAAAFEPFVRERHSHGGSTIPILVCDGALLALKGQFAAADALLKKVSKAREERDFYRDYSSDNENVDNVPERMMIAMCAAVANPEKIAKTRPAKIMRILWRSDSIWRSSTDPDDRYVLAVEKFCESFSKAWSSVISGKGEYVRNAPENSLNFLVTSLVYAWDYRTLANGRKKVAKVAAQLLNNAKTLWENGYANLAALYLSLLSGSYDKENEAQFVNAVNAVTHPFLPELGPDVEWLSLLNLLKKSLASAENSEKREEAAKKNSIVWCLSLHEPGIAGVVDITGVRMFLRPADGSEDGSDDKEIDYAWHSDQKAVRSAMNEKDLLLLQTLKNHGTYYSDSAENEVLKLLVGMDNIYAGVRCYDNLSYEYRMDDLRRVTVLERNCEMKSSVTKDGGLKLSLPLWNITPKTTCVPVWVDFKTIAIVSITPSVRKFLDIFAQYGEDGSIIVPAAGMKDAAPVIQSMSRILPFAAPTELEKKQLRRVEAASDITVRLAFDGAVLLMQAFVKPVAAMPDLVVSPGEGQTEKVVADAEGGYLLVRSLDAEKARLAELQTALSAAETWFDGKFTWTIDDIAAALDALAAVKTLTEKGDGAFSLEWREDRRLNVTNAPKSGVTLTSSRSAEDWFRVDGEWTLDDGRVISIAKMLEAARSRIGDFVRLSDGDFVRLTSKMARQLSALSAAGRRKGDGVEVCKAAIPMLDGALDGSDGSLALPDAMARTAEEIRSVFARRPKVPGALNAELRPYQVDGFRWLSRLAGCAFGSCLADDMGLGKTLQIIAVMLERSKDGASLVIAPSSVCGNWRSELRRFAPSLRPLMAYDADVSLSAAGPLDIVIASYNYVLFHEDEFAAVQWNGLVLDEAQAIKNDASKRAKAVKRLPSKFRIAATGTPVENRLGELWSLFDFLNPGLLGPATSFASRFTVNGRASPELKRLVKPLILRRLKNDVLDDLPEKTETTIEIELGAAEREAYEACRIHALSQLEKASEAGDGEPNRISILAQLTRLRRFCCHPSLVLPDEKLPSAKMEALVDLLGNLREGSHRALVFSQFTDYLAIVRSVIKAHGWSHLYLDGTTPAKERERLVNDFQAGDGDFFVISLKAGGTGLNLTAADYVILLDPWWNPAVENQAADRAHRIGQANPVTVYRLIASRTVEERVLELHKEKKEIAEDVLDATGSTSLSPAQLMRLFQA